MASLSETARQKIETFTGSGLISLQQLSGGCVAEVFKVALEDGRCCVAKVVSASDGENNLTIEAEMLRFLATASELPVPGVLAASDDLLLMDYVQAGDPTNDAAQEHAAELLAELHSLTAPAFGFANDTLIGPLPQPNAQTQNWIDFFRDRRLLYMGRIAFERGRLPGATYEALGRFCARLDQFLPVSPKPALLHGDVWDGNLLVRDGRIAAFIDPAIYYGDPEIELAFSTLFGTFGESFFARYQEIRPLEPGFFESRREIYNLYPLLVHTALFGGSYAASVAATLRKYC